jgi:hypothetical protein
MMGVKEERRTGLELEEEDGLEEMESRELME